METKTKSSVYPMAMTAVMAAVIAVVAPFSIPAWGEVSFTLCTFVLYLSPIFWGGRERRLRHWFIFCWVW